jgi:hypothetical protein
MREAYLKRTYGLSESDYEAQVRSQNYLCAVCHEQNKPGRDGEPENLAVDHNHRTGANRGLLCQRCNRVLGMLGDSQELLFRLLEYLRTHDGSAIPYIPDNPITRASREAAWEASFEQPSELPVEAPAVGSCSQDKQGPLSKDPAGG